MRKNQHQFLSLVPAIRAIAQAGSYIDLNVGEANFPFRRDRYLLLQGPK